MSAKWLRFPCLSFLLLFQAISLIPVFLSKRISSHGALRTGSASERLTPTEELYKCFNTTQYNNWLFSYWVKLMCGCMLGKNAAEVIYIRRCWLLKNRLPWHLARIQRTADRSDVIPEMTSRRCISAQRKSIGLYSRLRCCCWKLCQCQRNWRSDDLMEIWWTPWLRSM